jgi:PAS domain-containing protein
VTSGAAGVQPARLVVDAQERVIEANREAGERFGLGADGLVGLPISAVNAALDGYVEHYRDSDRAHFTIEVLGEPCRAANVALRDAAGVARMAVILVAPQGTAPPEPA